MLKRHAFLALVILLSGTHLVADDPASAIRETLDDQVAAWNRGDLKGFMDGYVRSEDLVFTSGGNVRRGWETTYKKYRERYGTATETMGTLSFDRIEIHPLADNAAWVLGYWKLDYSDESSEGGVFTLVMARSEGKWRVVHDHTSVFSD